MKKVILIFVLVFILINVAPVKAESKILVLHSYHQGLKWTDEITRGIQSVFSSEEEVNVYYEYLDVKRNYSSEYYDQLIELYKNKSQEMDFEAVIACDNAALDFILKHRKKLYPQTPVVFCGINNYKPELIEEHKNITGVMEKASHKENIDLILKLHPELSKLVVVNDNTLTGKKIKDELNKILPLYRQQVKIEVINKFTVDSLQQKLSQISKQAVVYLLVINRDSSGKFISYSRGIKEIKEVCDNPIYGAWDFYLDEGVIGGKLISGYKQGRKAAQLVQRILNGEQAAKITIQKNETEYMFDYNQLREFNQTHKFNVTLNQLPEDSKVINYTYPFYLRYKHWSWEVRSGMLVLLIVIFILVINILKRKQAEYELQNANEQLEKQANYLKEKQDKLLNIAEVGVLVLNKEGEIKKINKQGYQVLDSTRQKVIGKNIFDNYVKGEGEQERLKRIFERLIKGERIDCVKTTVLTRLGKEREIISRTALLKNENRQVKGVLISALDITEQESLREKLEYNKFKVQFFANLAHELKTPLNLSFSALQMLNQYRKNNLNSEVNEKLTKYTEIIKQNNYRLLRLTDNIVDVTKIDSNSFDLKLQNHDIVKLVQNVTSSVADYLANRQQDLKFNSELNSKIIACDRVIVERIILNLLSNAVKFTEKGDEIFVKVSAEEELITITVSDTGVGITEEKQEMIFKRFRQVDKSFTRQNEGSGVGLTLVKLLIELHEGVVRVDSQQGEFSKFIIKLPDRRLARKDSIQKNNKAKKLIERIKIEFSDVYDL